MVSCILIFLLCNSAGSVELSRTVETLRAVGAGPYQLERHFIIESSDSVVFADTLLARDKDYKINYRLGLLTFQKSLPDSASVTVTYRFFPFEIKERYYTHEITTTPEGDTVITEKQPELPKESESAPSTLIIGGSKSLGISVTTGKDPALEQALRVNVSGMAAEGVEVKAILSDQSTPIQPEGTTEELEEFDQVVIQIQSKNVSGSFGDYDFDMANSSFGDITRKLEGGMGEGRYAGAGLMLAAARNRGSFSTNRFWGTDGKQGPYQLASEDGRTDIVVVAGSEKVYVDGQQKRRGENNDYVIDYASAQVTFTSRVLMTSRSRIVVDFEYAVMDYRRTLYATGASYTGLGDKLSVGGNLFFEGDDKDSPLSLNLTPERKDLLQSAGDDTTLAWALGGVQVGDSLGSYIKQDSIYVYVGYGKGDYSVSFSKMGENRGDYDYDYGMGGYKYVGNGMGDYAAKVRLPLPAKEEFHSISAQYEIAKGTAARVEYAGSNKDENSFSSIGDTNNAGSAYNLSFDAGLGERFSVASSYRTWDDRFNFPGRRNTIDYEDAWNVREAKGKESAGEVKASLSPLDLINLTADLGRLDRAGGKADKVGLGAFFKHGRFPSISYTYGRTGNSLDTTATRIRHNLTATERLGWVSPRFSLFTEESKARLREGSGGVGLGSSWVTGDISYSHRLDDIPDGAGWAREATVRTAMGSFETAGIRALSGSLNLVHRDKTYEEGLPGENSSYDLASLRMKARPVERRMSVEARYELTQTQLRTRREVYYQVQEGTGDYSKDPNTGEYYPDPEGDYRREIAATGDYRPVADVSSSCRLYLLPVDLLSFDGFASAEEKMVQEKRFSIYKFDFGDFHNDNVTLYGIISYQADVNLFPYLDRSVGVRYRHSDYEDNQLEGVHEERDRNEISLLGKAKLTRTVSGDAEIGTRNEERRSAERGVEKKEDWVETRSTLTWRPNNILEPSVSLAYEKGDVNEPFFYDPVTITSREVSPILRYYLTGRGRAEIDLTFADRDYRKGLLPADISSLYPLGLTTTARSSLEYRINEWLSALLNHTVKKEPNEDYRHTLSAQMQANF
jgi:hypothetical protein